MAENQVPQWIFSLIGGGLAGSTLTIIYNSINAKIKSKNRENALIAALIGELTRSKLPCEYNAKLKGVDLATFIHFPSIAAIKTTFEERDTCRKLVPLLVELEYYTLALLQLNEMIDQYRLLFTVDFQGSTGGSIANYKKDLCIKIGAMCSGEKSVEGTGLGGSLSFPEHTENLLVKVKGLA